MAVQTSAGARVSIGPATTAETVEALAALSYVPVGKVENVGEIGPQGTDVTFVPLDGSDVLHLKGAIDNGATTVTCGRLPADAGQLAMAAAARTKFEYAVKIELADAATEDFTDTVIYVRGPVMGSRLGIGGGNDVTRVTFGVGNNIFLLVPSEEIPEEPGP